MAGKFLLAALATSFAVAAIPATPAFADDDRRYYSRDDDRRWRDDRRYDDRRFRGNARFRGGNNCYDEGKGGTVIGAIAGGLLGNTVAGRGDKLLGTVIGGGVGAVAGRSIDRADGRPCR